MEEEQDQWRSMGREKKIAMRDRRIRVTVTVRASTSARRGLSDPIRKRIRARCSRDFSRSPRVKSCNDSVAIATCCSSIPVDSKTRESGTYSTFRALSNQKLSCHVSDTDYFTSLAYYKKDLTTSDYKALL